MKKTLPTNIAMNDLTIHCDVGLKFFFNFSILFVCYDRYVCIFH